MRHLDQCVNRKLYVNSSTCDFPVSVSVYFSVSLTFSAYISPSLYTTLHLWQT